MGRTVGRMVRAHHALQRVLYFTEAVELSGGTAYFADGLTESQWNHAVPLEDLSARDFSDLLDDIGAVFRQRQREPAVELAAMDDGLCREWIRMLESRGYSKRYRYAWLVPDEERPGEDPAPDGVEIRAASSQREADGLFAVFRAVYGDELEDGYRRALSRPPANGTLSATAGCRVVHHVAYGDGEPLAVASSIHGLEGEAAGVTGLYNLAVHPDHRRRGLGRLLTGHRVRDARKLGQRLIFLQTERLSVESWQRRHGFRLAFVSEGFALPTLRNPDLARNRT